MSYSTFCKDYFIKIIFTGILLTYFTTITNYSYSQNDSTAINFEEYQPLQSKGTVPQDFLLSVSERYVAKI